MFVGFLAIVVGEFRSTVPSFAARAEITGRVSGCTTRRLGKGNYVHYFSVQPEIGAPVNIETHVLGPMCWASSRDYDDRVYRVLYLRDARWNLFNEGIQVDVLSGRDTGWHSSLDARPFGLWLLMPIGGVFLIVGNYGIRSGREPESSTNSEATAIDLGG